MKKEITLKFSELKNSKETVLAIYKEHGASLLDIFVHDIEYNDMYEIRLMRTNKGIGGLCFLNGIPSFQADFKNGGSFHLKTVINNIAGGTIIE